MLFTIKNWELVRGGKQTNKQTNPTNKNTEQTKKTQLRVEIEERNTFI